MLLNSYDIPCNKNDFHSCCKFLKARNNIRQVSVRFIVGHPEPLKVGWNHDHRSGGVQTSETKHWATKGAKRQFITKHQTPDTINILQQQLTCNEDKCDGCAYSSRSFF